jgi:hypothetical protein
MSMTDRGLDVWWNHELDQDCITSFPKSLSSTTTVMVIGVGWLEKNQRICCTVHVLKVLDEDDNIIFTHTDPSDYTNADAPRSFVIDVNPDTVVRVGKKVRNEPSEQTLTPSSCYLSSLYYLVTQSLTLSRLLFIRHPPSASMDSMMAS